jgi:membrane protein implicated in regulation of membrane protease activity
MAVRLQEKSRTRSVRIFCGISLAKATNCPKMWCITHNGGLQMDTATFWWIAAAALVIAELLTGTIYLLAVAAGGVAGALAAHAGLGLTAQIAIAAVVGTITTLAWHFSKARQRRAHVAPAHANTDVNQDIGAQVMVNDWQADGTAQVSYRGAQWTVLASQGADRSNGQHRVKEVLGNRLVVEKI